MPNQMPVDPDGLERIETLATVHRVEWVQWDALGTVLVVRVLAGPPEKPAAVTVGLTPAAATELWSQLDQALQEREDEEGPRQ